MRLPPSWSQSLTPARLATLTSLLLVVAIAWTLARATWMLMPGADGQVGQGTNPQTAGRPMASQTVHRLQSVADLSLFGSAPVAVATGSADAPQTQLNLILRGVWANPSRSLARAIIAAGNAQEQAYKVGDTLPGGVVLDQVHPDRVILKRGGGFEALYLPKESMGGVVASSPATMANRFNSSPAPVSASTPAEVGAKLQEYRQRILNNPAEIYTLARMQPVMEGDKIKGYKVSPNRDKQLFRDMGLRPGDIITSVNGLSLSDPAAAGQVLTQVASAGQVTLIVDRGGREETIVVPIGQ